MIKRDAEDAIRSLLRGFPIVTITGPRQSGKTTLAKAIFPEKPYATLEEPDIRLAAREDPRSFLERFPDGAVLDEVIWLSILPWSMAVKTVTATKG